MNLNFIVRKGSFQINKDVNCKSVTFFNPGEYLARVDHAQDRVIVCYSFKSFNLLFSS